MPVMFQNFFSLAALLIEILILFIYLFVAYLIINVFESPVQVVWCVEYLYAGLLGIVSFIYLKTGKWKNKIV